MTTPEEKKEGNWFYVHLPKNMEHDIDDLLDKHGSTLGIYTPTEFVRDATREWIMRLRFPSPKPSRTDLATTTS